MQGEFVKEMVERVSWFSPVDYEILMFYENHDILATSKVVSANIEYDRQYVNKRLRALREDDLFESEDGLYQLSDRGRAFLDGDLAPGELEDHD